MTQTSLYAVSGTELQAVPSENSHLCQNSIKKLTFERIKTNYVGFLAVNLGVYIKFYFYLRPIEKLAFRIKLMSKLYQICRRFGIYIYKRLRSNVSIVSVQFFMWFNKNIKSDQLTCAVNTPHLDTVYERIELHFLLFRKENADTVSQNVHVCDLSKPWKQYLVGNFKDEVSDTQISY